VFCAFKAIQLAALFLVAVSGFAGALDEWTWVHSRDNRFYLGTPIFDGTNFFTTTALSGPVGSSTNLRDWTAQSINLNARVDRMFFPNGTYVALTDEGLFASKDLSHWLNTTAERMISN
jgi:hypothetical protein